jgi:hypothetical protein
MGGSFDPLKHERLMNYDHPGIAAFFSMLHAGNVGCCEYSFARHVDA